MTGKNREILKAFTEENMPDLDVAVLGALELFQETSLAEINTDMYKRPMVVGSGNAEATGRIIFEDHDAVFASESTYAEKIKNISNIDGVVLISASGGKHAPIIARDAKRAGKHITLITNEKNPPAGEYASEMHVFPKNREPYTYNTSTYMGMIFGMSKEEPDEIDAFIRTTVDAAMNKDLAAYDKFYVIVPPQFAGIIRMLQVKFIELFGRRVARDIETSEYIKHATTVVPSEKELFISFGEKNTMWGRSDSRMHIPLPENMGYGAMMAIAYYVIGNLQKAHPPYFKENIVAYARHVSEVFNQEIKPIVE